MFGFGRHRKLHLLVVDDSQVARRVHRRILEDAGYTHISEACNGIEALDLMEKLQIDILLTDWRMPHCDGLELVTKLRAKRLRIPVIMISRVNTRDSILQAINAGVSSYIVKPFSTKTLLDKLSEQVEVWYGRS